MLPSNLLVARVWRGWIKPLLLRPEGLALALAGEILDRFRGGVGRSREEILGGMYDLEELALEAGMDMRVVRAMATLAARRARFESPKFPFDPTRVRLVVFEEASRAYGFTLSEDERVEVLERVAGRLGCSIEELDGALRHYQEEVLVEPPQLDPASLIREYNLSMVQTLLFKASRLTVYVEASGLRVKEFLRTVKLLGLLYMAERAGRGVRLVVDGPASILRQTRRYGTRLAKLIPHVLPLRKWKIEADILARSRKLKFQLSDSRRWLFPSRRREVEPVFDSRLEEEFYRSMRSVAPSWIVEREPEPLVAGIHIFIPDFAITVNGRRVYLEIVGFWTKEYLERKLEKLRRLSGTKLIVAVDEELACSSFKELPHEVVVFRGRLRGADVYPVVKRVLGIERVERRVEEVEVDLESLRRELPDFSGRTLRDAVAVLREKGVSERDAARVLEMLGYRIRWRSLDPRAALIERRGE